MKVCSKCRVLKPSKDFHKHQKTKDGLQYWCIACGNENDRRLYKENPEPHRREVREYRLRNLEKCRASDRRKYDVEKARSYRRKNPDVVRRAILKREYGISLEEYAALSVEQGGLCAICKGKAKLCVDHDHVTGKVRGLLCGPCNRALGLLKDSGVVAHSAGKYLTDWVDKQKTCGILSYE